MFLGGQQAIEAGLYVIFSVINVVGLLHSLAIFNETRQPMLLTTATLQSLAKIH